jgi:hypothetical protein
LPEISVMQTDIGDLLGLRFETICCPKIANLAASQCLWAVRIRFCGNPFEHLCRDFAGLSIMAERWPGGWKNRRSENNGPTYASE